ncbi:MAG TPA: class I SAM-dependent methyltransferase [Thermoanaerobaculia bacterium]|nr:class I SAM-dependent methyltransferase [Thermoanaerobaculia bacterium]
MRLIQAVRTLFGFESSAEYEIIDGTDADAADGWRSPEIAARQHEQYGVLLRDVRAGRARADLRAAADAVREAGIHDSRVVEIGCGSGYYSEILAALTGSLRYLGIDYSAAMIRLARKAYPRERFVVADAARLPLANGSCDVALSGNSLMHIPAYAGAVKEMARVARRWCVFHAVPVLEQRATTRLRKKAYGTTVFELTFNRAELESLFADAGLAVRSVREVFPYDLSHVLGEHTRLLTYACETRS